MESFISHLSRGSRKTMKRWGDVEVYLWLCWDCSRQVDEAYDLLGAL